MFRLFHSFFQFSLSSNHSHRQEKQLIKEEIETMNPNYIEYSRHLKRIYPGQIIGSKMTPQCPLVLSTCLNKGKSDQIMRVDKEKPHT